jgi:hypothetical protein
MVKFVCCQCKLAYASKNNWASDTIMHVTLSLTAINGALRGFRV